MKEYKAIWQAVIRQAFFDSCLNNKNPTEALARRRARQWLLEDVEDFNEVCGLAGFTPRKVRAAAVALEQSGWKKSRKWYHPQHEGNVHYGQTT